MSSSVPIPGTPSHVRRGKPASMKLISTPMLSGVKKIVRSKDNEGVGAATGVPGSCGVWQWSEDYAARPVRGDPRGRKSGAGPGATNRS